MSPLTSPTRSHDEAVCGGYNRSNAATTSCKGRGITLTSIGAQACKYSLRCRWARHGGEALDTVTCTHGFVLEESSSATWTGQAFPVYCALDQQNRKDHGRERVGRPDEVSSSRALTPSPFRR